MAIRLTDEQLSKIRRASNLCRSIALMIPTAKKKATMTGECAMIAIDADAIDNLISTSDTLREIANMAEHVPDLPPLKNRVNELGEHAGEDAETLRKWVKRGMIDVED